MQTAPSLSKNARIAHLSDVHMLAARPGPAESVLDWSTRIVSFGRALDPQPRIRKLQAGLAAARASGADHLVISGDLTELGTPAQFEAFAEVLLDAGVDPDRLTLVPGNHDAYTRADAWSRALDGPLSPFRRGAAHADGGIVERDHAIYLPLDVACHQHFTRASGELSASDADALERRVFAVAGCGLPIVVVVHHSPLAHSTRAWQWLHGLRGHARLLDLLSRVPELHVLHGHLHYEVELPFGLGLPRILGAPAVVDDKQGSPRIRLYDVEGASLRPTALDLVEASLAATKPALAA